MLIIWTLDLIFLDVAQPLLAGIPIWTVSLLEFVLAVSLLVMIRRLNSKFQFTLQKALVIALLVLATFWRSALTCNVTIIWMVVFPHLALVLISRMAGTIIFAVESIKFGVLVSSLAQPVCSIKHGYEHSFLASMFAVQVSAFVIAFMSQEFMNFALFSLRKSLSKYQKLNEKLSQARDAAITSNILKSRFLSLISHELNTPMSGVLGFASLLRRMELEDPAGEYVKNVEECAERLQSQINDMLVYSKLEAGNLQEERSPFLLPEVVEKVVCALAASAHSKGLDVLLDIEPNIPCFVNGDSSFFHQVLRNLLVNAIKFTNHGEVRVCIKCQMQDEDDVTYLVSVSDTGVGIPTTMKDVIFEAFVQADNAMSRSHDGSGLGLAIAKKLTQKMKGTIWVDSTGDKGSVFCFTCCFQKENELPSSVKASFLDNYSARFWGSEGSRTLFSEEKDPWRFIIVEDLRASSDLLLKMMRIFSREVSCSFSYEGAMKFLQDEEKSDSCRNTILICSSSLLPGKLSSSELWEKIDIDLRSVSCKVGFVVLRNFPRKEALESLRASTLSDSKAPSPPLSPHSRHGSSLKKKGSERKTALKVSPALGADEVALRSRDDSLINSPTPPTRQTPKSSGYERGFLVHLASIPTRIMMRPVTLPKLSVTFSDLLHELEKGGGRTHAKNHSSGSHALKFRVLLVDDNEINLKVASKMLERYGHIPVCVTSGAQAIQLLFGELKFDLILMDIFMPGMSGLEATKAIRLQEQCLGRSRIPIIAVTANATMTDREQCLESDMDEYLTKPFTPQKLEQVIHRTVFRLSGALS